MLATLNCFIKFSQEATEAMGGSGAAASVAAIVNTATETRVDKNNNMDAARRRPALAGPARQNPQVPQMERASGTAQLRGDN